MKGLKQIHQDESAKGVHPANADKLARKGCGGTLTSAKQQCPPHSVLRAVSEERKGCGAHPEMGQELFRAALRFARVPQ
jgi:hypothetical protein